MATVISIHSFRGGTGKSNITANLAALLARTGRRVAVVDTDIQSPGIHVLFAVGERDPRYTLNDYLWGNCELPQAALDLTTQLGPSAQGALFLVPSSSRAGDIARVLREGYDVDLLKRGFRTLIQTLKLDVLLVDTHPGLNEDTLLSMALSTTLLILLRPDQQDFLGTGVTVQVARKLGVPRMVLLVNKVPLVFDPGAVQQRVEQAYQCPVIGVLPHTAELMVLASDGLFILRYPDHPVTTALQHVAARLMESPPDDAEKLEIRS
jgi:MinD-like ATPase involved in chromosome partitioning or flagellar assembly